MSNRGTSADTGSAISSPELRAGRSPSGSPAFQTTFQFGQEVAPVNRFRTPAAAEVRRTNGTSGRNSTASSASASLQSSLASRLAVLTDLNGSMEYRLTWKRSVTPSGRVICRLRASARPTSDSDSSGGLFGWPTPANQSADGGVNPEGNTGERFTLQTAAQLAGWPTPIAAGFEVVDTERMEARRAECKERTGNGNGFGLTLGQAILLWVGAKSGPAPVPTAGPSPESGTNPTAPAPNLSGWGTPSARDHKDAGPAFESDPSIVPVESRLPRQAALAGWATPNVPNGGQRFTEGSMSPTGRTPDGAKRSVHLQEQVVMLCPPGPPTASSLAPTAVSGGSVLNPAMSRWLMGYPQGRTTPGWDTCSPGWKEWATVQRVLGEWSGPPRQTES
jgi:hypothetical protein